MSFDPKRPPPRGRPARSSPPEKKRSESISYDDDELSPLREDDPRPQKVAQIPTSGRRAPKRQEESIPTTVYSVDEEFQQSFDPKEISEPGHRPAFVYVERGPGAGQLVPIRQGPLVIGRASISDLRLNHASVSRRHAQITRVGDRFYAKDLGSQNGTFVNRTRLLTEVEIAPGDQIAVGNAQVRLRGPLQAAQAPDSTSTATRPARRKSGLLAIAAIAAAIGAIVAGALLFGLSKLPQLAASSPPEAPQAEIIETEKPVVPAAPITAQPTPPPETLPTAPAAAESAQLAARVQPSAPAPTPEPTPVAPEKPAPPATAAPRPAKAAAVARTKTDSVAVAPVEADRKAILATFEEGDVEAAIAAAQKAGDKVLAARLTRFHTAAEAGRGAIDDNKAAAAIKSFEEALTIDKQLSNGRSPAAAEMRLQLSRIYTLAGLANLKSENTEAAKEAFRRAVSFDAQNSKARAELARLEGETKPVRRAMDDAWGDGEGDAPDPGAETGAPGPKKSKLDTIWEN